MSISKYIIHLLGGYTESEGDAKDAILDILDFKCHDYSKRLTVSTLKLKKSTENNGRLHQHLQDEINQNLDLLSKLESTKPFDLIVPNIIISGQDLYLLDHRAKNQEILDSVYTIPTLNELKTFLKYNRISSKVWTRQYDCDNFALELWHAAKQWNSMLCLGMVTITRQHDRHAVNCAVVFDEDKDKFRFVYIEPQTDVISDWMPGCRTVDNMWI